MKNNIIAILFYFCSAFIFLSGSSRAEGVNLEQIVVTASRSGDDPAEVSRDLDVISASEISRSGAGNVAEALSALTSVNISDYGGAGAVKTMRMRGSSAAQVLVMIDGRPVNSPRDGEADLSAIPLDNIEKIEVLHGPGSSLYGAGAMGGVVNIITRRVPQGKQRTELYTGLGTFRTYTERFSHGARVEKFGYLLSGSYIDSEGDRINSVFTARDFNAKLEYSLNDNSNLNFNAGGYKSRLGTPGLVTAEDIDDEQKNNKNFLDLGWEFKPDEDSRISARGYRNYERMSFLENSAGSLFDIAGSKDFHVTKSQGTDMQYNRRLSEYYEGTCGFNYVGNFNDSTTSGKHDYNLRAWYLENKLDLLENLKLNLGARVDDYSNFGSEMNPSLGVVYNLAPDLKLHGSLSRSFRSPTFNDLYWPDQGWIKGNSDLSPEKGITKELGIDKQFGSLFSCGLSYYRSDYRDLISWVDQAGVWQPTNVGAARIQGVEFKNKLSFSQKLDLSLAYTFLRAEDKYTNKYLVYRPRNKADLSLNFRDAHGFSWEFKTQFTGRSFYDSENTVYLKQYVTCGLSLSKRVSPGWTCFASIDNLFNKKYQILKDYPMPGFSLSGGVKVEF